MIQSYHLTTADEQANLKASFNKFYFNENFNYILITNSAVFDRL